MASDEATIPPTVTDIGALTPESEFEELQFPEPSNEADISDGAHVSATRNEVSAGIIPFRFIFNKPTSLKNPQRPFLPRQPIEVKITTYEYSPVSHILNPNLYSIEIRHGDFHWTVKRRYSHFQHLHQQLQLLKASMNIPLPTKTHREKRASFKTLRIKERNDEQNLVPRFPMRPEPLITADQMERRMLLLENYLKAILANEVYRQHHETLSFLEISPVSFVSQLGQKGKEGLIKKRSATMTHSRLEECAEAFRCASCCFLLDENCSTTFGIWNQRWLFVKDTFVGYIRPDTGEIGCVLLMDQGFKVTRGVKQKRFSRGFTITNLSRQLYINSWTKRKAREWIDSIHNVLAVTGKDFTLPNRFGSFVPLRSDSQSSWFVDGKDYMSAVADAIESANEEIFITDWWLSPEIYMKRPSEGDHWRLDILLRRKAEEGVRIFVLLYKEVELALGIKSIYSKQRLCSQHPNIKVLRHPDHTSGVLFWAHHEKLVVVDQTIAFLGGIDLCYGRWDDEHHRLTDLGNTAATGRPVNMTIVKASHSAGQPQPSTLLLLARAANNVTIGTVTNTLVSATKSAKSRGASASANEDESESHNETQQEDDEESKSKKATIANKMKNLKARGREWAVELKDKGRHMREDGKGWVGKHFSSGTPYAESDIDPNEACEADELSIATESEFLSEQGKEASASKPNNTETSNTCVDQLWRGKDYTNFIVKDFIHLDQPFQDTVDRFTTPRMPWHDIGIAVNGKAARDLGRHFIQRWNAVKVEKMKENAMYPLLIPKSYQEFPPHYRVEKFHSTCTDVQVLRSVGQWSCGLRTTEDSIHQAYINAIRNAKHYIYIENQFFISLSGGTDEVSNRIGRCLYERILRAHTEGTRFRVYVIMPLLPGFEGRIGTASGTSIQAITHWNYASICRGNNSLMGRLREANIDPLNYVSFYGLRTHSELNGQLVTELIYVHSKLMIVDDILVICGSANINDRSLIGSRDSELALIVEDIEFEDSIMNGLPYKAGVFASSLRRRLFREHLGLKRNSDIDIRDPVSDSFYKETWIRIASINTKIYEDVFRCFPSDAVTCYAHLKTLQEQLPLAFTEPKAAKQMLSQIQGYIVLLPLHFLSQENLTPASGTAEALMPTSLWT